MRTDASIYTRSFSRFRGVDFSVDDTSLSLDRFANLKNMWKDWQSDDGPAVEAFPGYRLFASFGSKIYGIYTQRAGGVEYLLVHADKRLFRFPTSLRHQPAALASLAPIFSALPEKEGCGFQSGELFYLLVEGALYRVDGEGVCLGLPDERDLPYAPIVFYNGEYYEQRNLLTDEVREASTAAALEEKATEEYTDLVFVPLPSLPGCCAVKAGAPMNAPTVLHIPAETEIDGARYTVTGVAGGAFTGFTNLVGVSLPDTVTEIGAYAFAGCASLSEVTLPSSLLYIWHHAFAFCPFLTSVTLNEGLLTVGAEAFMGADSLRTVYFSGNAAAYADITFTDGEDTFPKEATLCLEATPPPRERKLLLCPLYTPALGIVEVLLGEEEIKEGGSLVYGVHASYTPIWQDGLVKSVCILVADASVLSGRTVTVRLDASPDRFSTPLGFKAFGEGGLPLSGRDAVLGCRTVGQYDGRIFFTGNPRLPNTVFFSAPDETGYNNPLYIGNLNYFNDGLSSVPNRALLGTGDMLMVIKEEGASEGGLYYHTAESTAHAFAPRIYPAKSGASGIGAVGGAINFRDDPVFLTRNGLLAVERQAVNLERSLALRSASVNLRLCREDLAAAKMAVFEGYLFILTRGNLYLADSRESYRHPAGDTQYEFYYLTGVGDFVGDAPLYRYAEALPPDAEKANICLHERGGEEAEGTVYSLVGESGALLYYVEQDGKRYGVDTDGERTGGTLSPAVFLVAGADALYFATENGAVGCFNTDKRGEALYCTVPSALYYEKEGRYLSLAGEGGEIQSRGALLFLPLYEEKDGVYLPVGVHPVYQNGNVYTLATLLEEGRAGRIPAYFYSFNGHRYPVGCATAKDNGGIPNLRKNTASGTVALRLKVLAPTHLCVEARTDRAAWHPVDRAHTDAADFEGADFSAFSFSEDSAVTLPIREKERGWCEKQLAIFGEVFRSPFGVYGLSYSFGVAGKLHHRR
ncbi:MAG: leucine-rich repeat domain-containing protein [Clostridia bacterium]|nr:leucine-rich repeat domain-containing protein [Clostridia bacterium]